MLTSAALHTVRRRLLAQERRLRQQLERLARENRALIADGRAATATSVQRVMARRVVNLRESATRTAQLLKLVQDQQMLVTRLLTLADVEAAGQRFRAAGLLTRFNWNALLADVEALAQSEQQQLARLGAVLGALAPLLPVTPPAPAPAPAPAQPAGEYAVVARVLDGDTIVLDNGEHVRYIGIDAPEMHGLDGRPEPLAAAAGARNAALVAGRRVRLVRDRSERDRFGRLLRYVYVGRQLINAALVRDGLAVAYAVPPDTLHAARLAQLERQAQRARRGLWAAEP